MSFIDLIKSLALNFSWNKKTGTNSTQSKVRTGDVHGNVAGRDIHNTYVEDKKHKEDLPFVYLEASISSRNGMLGITHCRTFNLSSGAIVVEKIKFLDSAINMDNSIIKAGEKLDHTGVEGLSFPHTDEDRYLEIYFTTQSGKQYLAKQSILYAPRADGQYNVAGFKRPPIIKELKKSTG